MRKVFCDKCGNEISENDNVYHALIPCDETKKKGDDVIYNGQEMKYIELCKSCADSLMTPVNRDITLRAKCFDEVLSAIDINRETTTHDAKNEMGRVLIRTYANHDKVTINIPRLMSAIGYCTFGSSVDTLCNTVTDYTFVTE
jgi:hypothetical protein